MALVAGCFLCASCGARWSSAQQAEVRARYANAGSARLAPASTSARTANGATPNTGSEATALNSSRSSAAGPDHDVVAAATGLPCAAPSTAPGVAADVLTVANLASVSGPVAGLGATAQAGARAYVSYLNAKGGICGRQIKMLEGDDGNDGARSRTLVQEFASKALGIIGLFAPSSGGAAEIVEREKMPVLGTIGDEALRKASTVFNLNPPPRDPRATIQKYSYLISQGVKTAAVATLSNAAAVAEVDQQQQQIEGSGIRVVSRQILPITTISFESAARVIANSGADYLLFLGATQHDAALARAIRDTGYKLKFEEYATGYGSDYAAIAGPAAEGTSSWIRSLPAEDGNGNAELAAFLRSMRRYSPSLPPDVFAVDAWASAKAFFDALQQLPGPITRMAVVNMLRTYTDFDAGGLMGRIDLAHSKSNGCLIGMRFDGGAWHRIAPANGFLC